jgi:hypothetical protein
MKLKIAYVLDYNTRTHANAHAHTHTSDEYTYKSTLLAVVFKGEAVTGM